MREQMKSFCKMKTADGRIFWAEEIERQKQFAKFWTERESKISAIIFRSGIDKPEIPGQLEKVRMKLWASYDMVVLDPIYAIEKCIDEVLHYHPRFDPERMLREMQAEFQPASFFQVCSEIMSECISSEY